MRSHFLILAVACLAACSKQPVLPPAKPLSASAAQLAMIPGLAPGALPVVRRQLADWDAGDRPLRLHLVRPQGDGPYPLVVFSHGFGSDELRYDAVLDHWASHGYVVIAPYHLDGGGMPRGIFNSLRHGNEGLVSARVADVRTVLDHLDALAALDPDLPRLIDRKRIAVAGHSFGAFTAQQFGGAASVDPDSGRRIEGRDPRVRAVVAISPPGEMFAVINDQSWLKMDRPMLATTGTWDMDGRFFTDWKQHRLSYETAVPGRNWLLVIDGADHYLGNLICRPDREVAPQPDALRMLNATTTAFLDAQLKGDPAAQVFLASGVITTLTGGFATLTSR